MRLVRIAQLQGQCCLACIPLNQPLRRLVQPIPLDHPFRVDAHIPCEEALQPAQVDPVTMREVIHGEHCPVGRDGFGDGGGKRCIRHEFGPETPQELLHHAHAPVVVLRGSYAARQVLATVTPDRADRPHCIGEAVDRSGNERRESTRPEFCRPHATPSLECAHEPSFRHTGHPGTGTLIEDQVDARVRKRLGPIGRKPGQVPSHRPEVLDKWREVR